MRSLGVRKRTENHHIAQKATRIAPELFAPVGTLVDLASPVSRGTQPKLYFPIRTPPSVV